MALTLLDVVTQTRQVVGDTRADSFSPDMLKSAVNFAIKHYALKTGATYIETPVTLDENTMTYAIPPGCLKINRVYYNQSELVQSTVQFESAKSPIWQITFCEPPDFPERWLRWSGNTLRLVPSPDSLEDALIGYIEAPAALEADEDTVDIRISDYHAETLKYAASAWLLMLDGDEQNFAKSDTLMERFNALIGYSEPVLESKLKTMRTESLREI